MQKLQFQSADEFVRGKPPRHSQRSPFDWLRSLRANSAELKAEGSCIWAAGYVNTIDAINIERLMV